MDEIDDGHPLEQFQGQMLWSSDPARGDIDHARIGFGVGDELGHGLDRQRRVHLQHQRLTVDQRNARDVANEIESEIAIERGVDRVRNVGIQERISIGRRLHDDLGADIAPRARTVFNHERLAEAIRQGLRDQTRADIGRPARRIAHDQTHRPRRIGLRIGEARQHRQRGSTGGELKKLAAWECHGGSSLAVLLTQASTTFRHSPLILAALISGPQSSNSLRSRAASASGLDAPTETPSGSNFDLMAGSPSTIAKSAFIRLMISSGVLAGTSNAYHPVTSKPGTPDSAMAGNSDAVGMRCAVVTAIPRTCPVRAACSKEAVVLNMESMRPAMRSLMPPAATPR